MRRDVAGMPAAGEAENGEAGVKRGGRSVRKRKHITALARATLGDVRRVRPVGVRMDRLWTGDYSSYHRGKKKQQCDVHAVPAAAVATGTTIASSPSPMPASVTGVPPLCII